MTAHASRGGMFWSGCAFLGLFGGIALIRLISRDEGVQNAAEVTRLQAQGKRDLFTRRSSAPRVKVDGAGKTNPKIDPDLKRVGSPFDWPQWRGPMRDGHSAETGLNLNWTEHEPAVFWRASIGDGFGSIAVAEGRVYTQFQDGDQEVVACWNADTGDEIWRHSYEAKFKDEFGSGPRSTPAIDRGLVFSAGATGIVHCLDAATGKVKWRLSLADEFGASVRRWGFAFSPLVVDDLVLITPGAADGNSLAALDRKTGVVRWKALDVGGGFSSPVLAEIDGKRQAVFFTAAGVVSVVPESGLELWRYPWTTSYDANIATPIVVGDYVFISSGYGAGCALLRIEKDKDGRFSPSLVYKHTKMVNHFSSSVCHRGHLYGFNDALLTCLDVLDPKPKAKWTQRDFNRGNLILVEDHLFVLGENGRLGLIEATPSGYVEKGRIDLFEGRPCWSTPAVANGRLYVTGRVSRASRELVCLDLRKK